MDRLNEDFQLKPPSKIIILLLAPNKFLFHQVQQSNSILEQLELSFSSINLIKTFIVCNTKNIYIINCTSQELEKISKGIPFGLTKYFPCLFFQLELINVRLKWDRVNVRLDVPQFRTSCLVVATMPTKTKFCCSCSFILLYYITFTTNNLYL